MAAPPEYDAYTGRRKTNDAEDFEYEATVNEIRRLQARAQGMVSKAEKDPREFIVPIDDELHGMPPPGDFALPQELGRADSLEKDLHRVREDKDRAVALAEEREAEVRDRAQR